MPTKPPNIAVERDAPQAGFARSLRAPHLQRYAQEALPVRFILLSLLLLATSSASASDYQYLKGGETVKQPGLSFALPKGKIWAAFMRSSYQAAFFAFPMPKHESLSVLSVVSSMPRIMNKQDFLEHVKSGLGGGPEIGRFEQMKLNTSLYEQRAETCVVYQSADKDFGVEAKRGGEYSVYETFGMFCIHPDQPKVKVRVELSRKAPPGTTFPEFDAMAEGLLQSVVFSEF